MQDSITRMANEILRLREEMRTVRAHMNAIAIKARAAGCWEIEDAAFKGYAVADAAVARDVWGIDH